jgi:hypothetical protein
LIYSHRYFESKKSSTKHTPIKLKKMSTETKSVEVAQEVQVKAPRVVKEPRLPTKQSFAKKRTFFTDTSARHYHRHVAKPSEYFTRRLGEQGEVKGNETHIFWVVLSGEQTVPLPNSKISVITKYADEKVPDSKDEVRELLLVNTSADKETSGKRRKTGWVIAHGPTDLFDLFEKQRASAVAEQKQSRLSKSKKTKGACVPL